MSVLIKGMKIPTARGLCPFNDYCYCMAKNLYVDGSATHGRASFCPLVELPEKHGRLIDADALGDKMSGKFTVYDYQALGTMPTIVEAEGEDEERIDKK